MGHGPFFVQRNLKNFAFFYFLGAQSLAGSPYSPHLGGAIDKNQPVVSAFPPGLQQQRRIQHDPPASRVLAALLDPPKALFHHPGVEDSVDLLHLFRAGKGLSASFLRSIRP